MGRGNSRGGGHAARTRDGAPHVRRERGGDAPRAGQEACDDAHRTITLSGRLADEVRDLYNVDSEKRLCKVCKHLLGPVPSNASPPRSQLSAPCSQIYNGIHAEAFGFADVDAAAVKRAHNIPEDAKLVLCVGRLTTAKGPGCKSRPPRDTRSTGLASCIDATHQRCSATTTMPIRMHASVKRPLHNRPVTDCVHAQIS